MSLDNGKWFNAEYDTFIVESEANNYLLHVSGYSGNAGQDAFFWCNRAKFTTYDRENDGWTKGNCASRTGGGFWYIGCYAVGVNAAHSTECFRWVGLPGPHSQELQAARMWMKCK